MLSIHKRKIQYEEISCDTVTFFIVICDSKSYIKKLRQKIRAALNFHDVIFKIVRFKLTHVQRLLKFFFSFPTICRLMNSTTAEVSKHRTARYLWQFMTFTGTTAEINYPSIHDPYLTVKSTI